MKQSTPLTTFRLEDVVAGLEAKIDELIAITLRGQGLTPATWAEEILAEEAGDEEAST
jgi:hypothetical protein